MLGLNVCVGSACHIKGAYNVITVFQQLIEEYSLHGKIELKATFCNKQCHNSGVSVSVGGKEYSIASESAREFFESTVIPQL